MHLIDLSAVQVGDRTRNLDEDHVESLAIAIRNEGLLQPILLRESDNKIIHGGHRFAAFTILAANTDIPEEERKQYQRIPCLFFEEYLRETGRIGEGETISDGKLTLLELEENLKRLDMSWQEKSIGIYKYHRQQVRDSRKSDLLWLQETTGEMIGLSQASVSQNLKIGQELFHNPGSPLHHCESLADAIRLKLAQVVDAGARARASKVRAKSQAARPAAVETEDGEVVPAEDVPIPEPSAEEPFPRELLASLYRHGDYMKTLPLLKKEVGFDHIICDPPYAIDMKNLDTFDSIDRIEGTHQVEDNITMLEHFIYTAYDVLPDHGFLCMWYDLDMHHSLQQWGKDAGFKVCRWPLVWCKTSPCRNSVAQYNITKATEFCMFMRKSEQAVLVEKQPTNYILTPSISSKTHPFVKPFQVWERLITAVSMKNQTIVDPFAGEGSCLSAALQLERFAYGCEIEQKHIDQGVLHMHRELNAINELISDISDQSPF